MKRIICLAVLASFLAGPVLAGSKSPPGCSGRPCGGHQHGYPKAKCDGAPARKIIQRTLRWFSPP